MLKNTIISSIFVMFAGASRDKSAFMKEDILISFGHNVQKARKELGLSQEKLAEKAGLHRTYIGMIERAEKNITLLNIEKIATALNIEIAKLIAIEHATNK